MVKDAFGHTQTIYDKLKAQLDAQPKDDGSLLDKRKELQREVDIAKRAYTQQVCLKLLLSNIYFVIFPLLKAWDFAGLYLRIISFSLFRSHLFYL